MLCNCSRSSNILSTWVWAYKNWTTEECGEHMNMCLHAHNVKTERGHSDGWKHPTVPEAVTQHWLTAAYPPPLSTQQNGHKAYHLHLSSINLRCLTQHRNMQILLLVIDDSPVNTENPWVRWQVNPIMWSLIDWPPLLQSVNAFTGLKEKVWLHWSNNEKLLCWQLKLQATTRSTQVDRKETFMGLIPAKMDLAHSILASSINEISCI